MKQKILYKKTVEGFGTIGFRKLDIEQDIERLHQWVNLEYAVFWGLQNSSVATVKAEYEQLLARENYEVLVGEYNGDMAFLLERYAPQTDEIGKHYQVRPGDCGIHILMAPPNRPKANFTWHVFRAITDFVFDDAAVQRILVEPDIRNKKMFAICERIGFVLDAIVSLPHKTAQLAFYTKQNYLKNKNLREVIKRSAMNNINNTVSPQQAIAHINPSIWAKANRLLVRKAITEFAHERLITPKIISPGVLEDGCMWHLYSLASDAEEVYYTFKAQPLALNHLLIDADSVEKYRNDAPEALDALWFIKEFREQLGIIPEQMPVYLEEITSTLYGSAYKHIKNNPVSKELAVADFQTIEQSMMEGHPGFVANNGRIGFDSGDYRAYAPEAGNSFALLWLAGHKDRAVYAGTADLPYNTLIAHELDEATLTSFNQTIEHQGFDPADYVFIPIHPWQWFNKLANIFSPEIATGKLICLGYGPDQYMAQQSVRTLFNVTNPHKFYTKSSLSILNMGFMRGLPLYYLGTAPEMAVWLEDLLMKDSYIKETGFEMLGEIASVSYVNPYYEELGPHNDYNKMLASLWRESPMSKINERQRLTTMAALLHIDQEDNALVPELIKASGLSTDDWLRAYLKAYLSPLLHCFYQYDLVFMPHGENLILVLEDHVPVKALMKDITEEAVILNPDFELPENLKRMYAPVAEDVKLLSIFIDVFDGFFRYLSTILVAHAQFSEKRFWELVAENIHDYQQRFPELKEKFAQYDLFAPEFKLSCLNRLQLNNHKQMIDLDDPTILLQFIGTLENPVAEFTLANSQESVVGSR
ncbi:GNAT family N-acetyltransferase [Microscilla marina]|uniref:Siderophore biosynthesis protein, IucA/IucC family n=1 Tax=Microscilla marina ATCC 23134 TaxID=313606 RepID=A1ZRI0_MICM2|nr:GNAT family N-acetyltransferase [Microscilla marina]EAY27070.1 siderophore biosynthesis protein, IucA/IucC family [Microscilla marina ATCC 23134]